MLSMARAPRIDRHAVLTTSLAIADADGLDAVTMQAVARRLEVTPMALYHHVASKADLLDGLVECLLDELPAAAPDLRWDAQLIAMARGLRVIARRHPAVFPLLLQRPAMTPQARARRNAVVASLRTAGIAPGKLVHVERVISTLALGFAMGEVSGRFPHHTDATFRTMTELGIAGLAPLCRRNDRGGLRQRRSVR